MCSGTELRSSCGKGFFDFSFRLDSDKIASDVSYTFFKWVVLSGLWFVDRLFMSDDVLEPH
jgi:hypothetical protein